MLGRLAPQRTWSRSKWTLLTAAAGVAAMGVASACGLDTAGTSLVADAGSDATLDHVVVEAGPDADGGDACALSCNGECVTTCDTCTDKALACNGVCVASCQGCAAGAFICPRAKFRECVSGCLDCGQQTECGNCGTGRLTCEALISRCPSGLEAGACSCGDDAGACPGASHSCVGGACLTCGQVGTDGQRCKNGKLCDVSSARCDK